LNIHQIGLTNQKINAVKLQLEQLVIIAGSAENTNVLQSVYHQALYFHLILAYRAFLAEVSSDHAIEAVVSFNELQQKLTGKGVVCQYTTLLAELEQAQGWLSWLLASYQRCLEFEDIKNKHNDICAATLENKITITNIETVTQEQQFQLCYDNLQAIILQYRQLMQEW
jgi:hypothetical protein